MSNKPHEPTSEEQLQGTSSYQGEIPVWRRIDFRKREAIRNYVLNGLTLLFVIIMAFPVLWIISSSIRPQPEMMSSNVPFFPTEITFVHYFNLINNTDFPLYFYNSTILAGGVVIVTTTASTLGGYGLTRIDFAYKKTFARLILFGYMFPGILLAIPMFIFWRRLGIMNTRFGLILAVCAGSIPFSLWLMWKFFQTVPISYEESARMSGASRFRAMYEVALPMAFPGIIAVAIFAFAGAWSAYSLPLILMPDQSGWVLTVGLDQFAQGSQVVWPRILTGSMIMAIPPLIFLFTLQKYLLGGVRAGGKV